MSVNILHLYHDILNYDGEVGNVAIIKKHIEDQGYDVEIEKKNKDDKIDFKKYDFIYIGSGTEAKTYYAINKMKEYKNDIINAIENNTIFLVTGNSVDMFGRIFCLNEGIGIFDFETYKTVEQIESNVLCESEFLSGKIIGYINKNTESYHNMQPLFKVIKGVGENRRNDFEGIKYLNFYGTHLLGPVLSKNPGFVKTLVMGICTKVDKNFKYKDKTYTYEESNYKVLLNYLNGV